MTFSQITDLMKENITAIASTIHVSEATVQKWIDDPKQIYEFGIIELGKMCNILDIEIATFLNIYEESFPLESWL